jgi:hypothetical protein
VPLIGFAGAPLTLAGYLVQGGGSADYLEFRAWLARHPSSARVAPVGASSARGSRSSPAAAGLSVRS